MRKPGVPSSTVPSEGDFVSRPASRSHLQSKSEFESESESAFPGGLDRVLIQEGNLNEVQFRIVETDEPCSTTTASPAYIDKTKQN